MVYNITYDEVDKESEIIVDLQDIENFRVICKSCDTTVITSILSNRITLDSCPICTKNWSLVDSDTADWKHFIYYLKKIYNKTNKEYVLQLQVRE